MPAAQAPATDAAIEQSVRSAKASGENEWRRWLKLEWLTRLSSETSSKWSGIDLDGLWSISAKEKPGRRHHLTCLEVEELLRFLRGSVELQAVERNESAQD